MRELFRYRDLIWNLVVRDLKVRYRRSFLGFAWTMLQPLLTMAVLVVVFSSIFRFPGFKNYPVYALAGLLFWNFFQQSIVASMNSLKSVAYILQKLPVPMAVFPIATVISGLINLFFAMVPMFALLIVTDHKMGPSLLFLPVSILIAAIFTLGAGLLLAPLAVFFSDVVEFVNVVLMLLFYLTPIIYPIAIVEAHRFYPAVHYNPIRSILEVFRDPLFYSKVPPISHLSLSLLLALAMLAVGAWAFRRFADRIPFYI
ncbi:MAG: ABC transporter permease [Holophagales bacterium]|nr:ABC transporter permease [Holophagales bacterium]